jgi:hypothetical protein
MRMDFILINRGDKRVVVIIIDSWCNNNEWINRYRIESK